MKLRKLFSLMFYLVFTAFEAFSQPNCGFILGGGLFEGSPQQPVAFALVRVRETGATTQSDEFGNFKFSICKGNYTLEISHIECKHFTQKIHVEAHVELKIQLEHDQKLLQSVTIEAKKRVSTMQSFSKLKAEQIAELQGKPIADVLQTVAGVSALRTGTNIAKPMLQGMTGDRLPILVAGVRQIGQNWGLDHAPEIDPNAFDNIKILTGANSVRYGNGALGGAILLEPATLPDSLGYTGGGQMGGQNNGRGGNYNAFFQGKISQFRFRFQSSGKYVGNLSAPTYFLKNTGISELNFSAQLGYRNFNLFYSHFYTKIGILSDAHIGNVTDLLAAINRENPIQKGEFRYAVQRPAQQISHDFLRILHQQKTGDVGKIETHLAFQYNFRREYDAHRPFVKVDPSDFSKAEIGFEMPSATLRSEWTHRRARNWQGSVGFESNGQLNNTFAGALLPNFWTFDASIFAVEHWRKLGKRYEFEMGARYENRTTAAAKTNQNQAKTFLFDGFSSNLGTVLHVGHGSAIRFHVGLAWRSPNVSELLSNGVHHGTASFERGNLGLQSEKSKNFILSIDILESKNFELKVNLYRNQIKNFINLAPDTTWNDALQARGVVTTIRGTFPAFFYRQTDAILGGGDLMLAWRPFPAFSDFTWRVKAATLRARDIRENNWLALMPADKIESSFEIKIPQKNDNQYFKHTNFSITNSFVGKQNRIPMRETSDGIFVISDFSAAPRAYMLTHARAATTLKIGKQHWNLACNVENIFNIRYRDYLDRLRYFADAMGRNISFSINKNF
ncbi:MAG: hypothetical protein RL757_3330 [Bacteroidota bacterium]|jgi:iron complex outermembrane receptor protein